MNLADATRNLVLQRGYSALIGGESPLAKCPRCGQWNEGECLHLVACEYCGQEQVKATECVYCGAPML